MNATQHYKPLFRSQWDSNHCYMSRHSVNDSSACPLELVQAAHAFYRRTALSNAPVGDSTEAAAITEDSKRVFVSGMHPDTEFMVDKLPFNFRYERCCLKIILFPNQSQLRL